jgi:8-oxo-dGTP pyrophosphatase MutT (NUDIX family)
VTLPAAFDRLHQPHSLSEGWPAGGRQAAVLVAITAETEPRVLLARRALHLRLHAGEVAFPGGMRETVDASCWATAVREAGEEVALPDTAPQALRQLPHMVTRTGIEVHPCVARIPAGLLLQPDPSELDSVFYTPLALFAAAQNLQLDRFEYGGGMRYVPRYEIGDDTVWGVTAAILVQVVNIALDAQLDLKTNWNETS